jgi:xylulose-5-phosphate/fructose-6-phosphate phosphoketolase
MSTVAPGIAADLGPLSAYGRARSTVSATPLGAEELQKIDASWRACNYLSLGMIYCTTILCFRSH